MKLPSRGPSIPQCCSESNHINSKAQFNFDQPAFYTYRDYCYILHSNLRHLKAKRIKTDFFFYPQKFWRKAEFQAEKDKNGHQLLIVSWYFTISERKVPENVWLFSKCKGHLPNLHRKWPTPMYPHTLLAPFPYPLHGRVVIGVFHNGDAVVGLWSLAGCLPLLQNRFRHSGDQIVIVHRSVDAERAFVFVGNPEAAVKGHVASILWEVSFMESFRKLLKVKLNI